MKQMSVNTYLNGQLVRVAGINEFMEGQIVQVDNPLIYHTASTDQGS